MRLFRLMLAAVTVLLCPPVLLADTTYSYAGNPIDVYISHQLTGIILDGSFTLSSPIAPDSTFTASPDSFSFTNGFETFSNTNSNDSISAFSISTDASGNIDGWNIFLTDGNGGMSGDLETTMSTDFTVFWSGSGLVITGSNTDPGTWTEFSTASPVPEPSSVALLATGLSMVVGALRRRRDAVGSPAPPSATFR